MGIGAVIITVVQYFYICCGNLGLFSKLLAKHVFCSFEVTVEEPANQSQCKHVFATEYSFVIQSGIFQTLFAHR